MSDLGYETISNCHRSLIEIRSAREFDIQLISARLGRTLVLYGTAPSGSCQHQSDKSVSMTIEEQLTWDVAFDMNVTPVVELLRRVRVI